MRGVHCGMAAVVLVAWASAAGGVSAVRVATGDGALALELSATTGAITGLELSGRRVAPPPPPHDGESGGGGGFVLSEYLGDPPCAAGQPGRPAGNSTLLVNGDFAVPSGAAPGAAAGWAASSVGGYACTGYLRVTGANTTRRGRAAAAQAAITRASGAAGPELAGAAQDVVFTAATAAMFQTLVLSGWSKAEADAGANGTSAQAQDYSVYADVEFSDGTFSFGEAASFSTGAHDWEHASHAFHVPKPVKVVHLYAMYRNRVGKVWFSELALTGVPHASCMPRPRGTVAPARGPTGNWTVANVAATVAPPAWNGTAAGVTAAFEGLAGHIRITGAVALTRPRPCPYPNPCPPGDDPADRSVSLTLALPLAGAGWKLWSDPETYVVLPPPPPGRPHTGSRGRGHERTALPAVAVGGQSERVAGLPHTVDRYPMLVLTSPDSTRGVMLAVPMTPAVQVFRIQYDPGAQLLSITFDFGLTSRTQRFPDMATFACLLVPVARPAWGFRAGLQDYYDLFPEVWATNVIRNQGVWASSI